MEVHRTLGAGFLEAVYQEALATEFQERLISFKREVPLAIRYKGKNLACTYRADFVCFEDIIIEIKALKTLTPVESAQLINYLKATGISRGLLLNFGTSRLGYNRLFLPK